MTPGWGLIITAGATLTGTLGGVISTAAVNAWNTRIAANTRREDRQEERKSDYENWARQAKSDALKRLISACRFVEWRPDRQLPENPDDNYIRGATIRALDQFRQRIGGEDGISEIEAYAAKPVREALEKVLELITAQRREHKDRLSELGRIGTQLDAEPQSADLWRQRREVLEAIGSNSTLNVETDVIDLCDRLIDVARKDMQGGYTE